MWKKFLLILPGIAIAVFFKNCLLRPESAPKPTIPMILPQAPSYDDNAPCYVTKLLPDGSRIKAQIFCHTDELKLKDTSVICAYDREMDSVTTEGMGISAIRRNALTSDQELVSNLVKKKQMSVLGTIDSISIVQVNGLLTVRIAYHKAETVDNKLVYYESLKYFVVAPKMVIVLDYFLSAPDKLFRLWNRDLIEKAQFHFDLMAAETKITS